MTQESDESLMQRISGGDHRAFASLVRKHTNRFFSLAYRTLGQYEEAEDVVQEAFLKLWHDPQKWNPSKNTRFTTWFYRVVLNMCIDRQRKASFVSPLNMPDLLPDSTEKQDEKVIREQKERALEQAIQALPLKQKNALNLCFYEGVSNKEAADIMGVGVKALESLLMRAKAGLKDRLAREGGEYA